MPRSQLEILFERHIHDAELPVPLTNHRFHPTRKWESDFVWPSYKLIVEVEGGEWLQGGGRHNRRGKTFIDDCEKYIEAQILGWRVVRIPGTWVHNGEGIEYLARLFNVLMEQRHD